MSYTADDQQIDKITEQLIEDIRQWRKVAQNRRDDSESWKLQHIKNLTRVEKNLLDIELELKALL